MSETRTPVGPRAANAQLSLYVHAHARYHGELLCEWLLEHARTLGCARAALFRATAGFGPHGVIREEAFFELTDDLPMKLELLLGQALVEPLLDSLRQREIHVSYAWTPITFATLGGERTDG